MPALSLLLKPRCLVIMTCKQYTACTHGISTIVEGHTQASELASAAQLSSGGTYGATPRTEDENGGNGGAKRACYQGQQAMPESHYPGLPGVGHAHDGSHLPAPCFQEGGIIMQQKCGGSTL